MRSFSEISLPITEQEYRQRPELSYSTLSTFVRTGFNGLKTLFDRKSSPSLTFGSAVDAIVTGGMQEFNNNFIVAEFPALADDVKKTVMELFDNFKDSCTSLREIPEDAVNETARANGFWAAEKWKKETRLNKFFENPVSEYYDLMYVADGKTILDTNTYENVIKAVGALKNSDATKFYFQDNDTENDGIERLYQLKFAGEYDGIGYRCMSDLIVIDHNAHMVQPVDLKTSSHNEWDFPKSFVEWNYHIQARLYWRIIRQNMDNDPLFKDYELLPYKFIVVNKESLTPLVWDFDKTQENGTITVGKYKFRDPYDIGKELTYYLKNNPSTPIGVKNENSIDEWLNKI